MCRGARKYLDPMIPATYVPPSISQMTLLPSRVFVDVRFDSFRTTMPPLLIFAMEDKEVGVPITLPYVYDCVIPSR